MLTVKAHIKELPKISANLGTIQVVAGGGKKYEGDYNITPTFEKQTLPTDNRILTENMTVEAIRVVKVSNESGGNTIIIGG